MFTSRQNENNFLFFLRWTARILSAVSIGVLLLVIFADGLSLSRFTWEKMGIILLLHLGVITGLIRGWQEEAKGGTLAVFSVAVFYLAYGLVLKGSFSDGWWILLFLIPGSLLLLYSALSVASSRPNTSSTTAHDTARRGGTY